MSTRVKCFSALFISCRQFWYRESIKNFWQSSKTPVQLKMKMLKHIRKRTIKQRHSRANISFHRTFRYSYQKRKAPHRPLIILEIHQFYELRITFLCRSNYRSVIHITFSMYNKMEDEILLFSSRVYSFYTGCPFSMT